MIACLAINLLPLVGVEREIVGAAKEVRMAKPLGVEKAVQAGLA